MNPAASEREIFRCEEANFAVKVSIVTFYIVVFNTQVLRLAKFGLTANIFHFLLVSGFLAWTKSVLDKLAPLDFS